MKLACTLTKNSTEQNRSGMTEHNGTDEIGAVQNGTEQAGTQHSGFDTRV
jgi:hypothetical protein